MNASRHGRRAAPTVAPLSRAVRHALAVSALALTLAAPAGRSVAGECTWDDATRTYACNGEFAGAPDLGAGPFDDVTIVLGDEAPSSVTTSGTPAFQVLGSGDIAVVINPGSSITSTIDGTGYAPIVGVHVFGDGVDVANGGAISVESDSPGGRARARAIYAVGMGDGVSVVNDGDIDALAQADGGRAEAHGIYAFGYGSAPYVANHGDIDARAIADGGSAYATGINSIGYASGTGLAQVVNTGTIDAFAQADYAYAFGVFNLTRQRYGSAELDNSGAITAQAQGNYATAMAATNLALRYGDATTTNTGDITAVAEGTNGGSATGIYSHAYVYDSFVDNAGSVSASASGDLAIAVGIYGAAGFYGDSTVVNAGDIAVVATGGDRQGRAAGIAVMSENLAELVNYGTVDVTATAGTGSALAAGLYAIGSDGVTVRNYGDVTASATSAGGDATAYGALAFGSYSGTALIINGGSLLAEATAGAGATAYAVAAFATADVASVFNDGSATAIATAGDGGAATATGIWAYGVYAAASNYGDILAAADAAGGIATAHGAESYGYFGSALYNAGAIVANATADGGVASATGTYNVGVIFHAYTTNAGAITAVAQADSAVATGVINVAAYLGDAITTNAGDITAVAIGGIAPYGDTEAIAVGVYNLSYLYASVVDNTGSIVASASAIADVTNVDGMLQAKAIGANVLNVFGYWDAALVNSGDIVASAEVSRGYGMAWGAVVQTNGVYGGAAWLENAGHIGAYAQGDAGMAFAVGAYVTNIVGDAAVVNYGDLVGVAHVGGDSAGDGLPNYAYAGGITARTFYGALDIANFGSVFANAYAVGGIAAARAIQAGGAYTSVYNAAGAGILAIGQSGASGGGAFSIGIEAYGVYAIDVVNHGDILAYSHSHGYTNGGDRTIYSIANAVGIYASSNRLGDAAVTNTGDITAIAVSDDGIFGLNAGASAQGIHAYGKYDATVVNQGDIYASATSQFGIARAYGITTHGKYTSNTVNGADATIVAIAEVGALATDYTGAFASAVGIHSFSADYAYAVNDGAILVSATVTPDGDAVNPHPSLAIAVGIGSGLNTPNLYGEVVNHGDIQATARADYAYASAYGIYAVSRYDTAVTNSGDVLAAARADHGDAFAVGAYGYALHFDYYVPCTPEGCDYSNPIYTVDAGTTTLANTGSITAIARADGGLARSYGAAQIAAYTVAITNAGDIGAVAEGEVAQATGVIANSFYGDVAVANSGSIVAAAYGPDATATALWMLSEDGSTLVNTGTIASLGDGARIAIHVVGGGATIDNAGTVLGAIVTDAGDDTLVNTGLWHALGVSDFGLGVDTVANTNQLVLEGATIRMAGGDDTFANTGAVVVRGDSVLDLGSAFANDGAISLLDGDTHDSLWITGGVSGQGSAYFDVSGASQLADWLRIDGDVDAGSVQTLHVNLVDAPTSTDFLIPLVNVVGTSTAGNFVLGDVAYAAGFLDLAFDLHATIDASNATDDVFALGVAVTGLSDTGALAATLAPGVQALAHAQVGTWRQRSGALPRQGESGLSPWLRLYSGSGGLDLDHDAAFDVGEVGFRQSNQGFELGIEARPNDRLALGLLLGSSDADQRLRGTGDARLHGRTVGVFGTWRTDAGFYLDLSHRWTGVDATLRTAAGEHRVDAAARTTNIEAGFDAWTLGKVHVVPQLQLTRTEVGDVAPIHAGTSTFVDDGGASTRARLGVAFEQRLEAGGWLLTPYASLNLVHELEGEYEYAINGGLDGTTRADGTGAQVEVGLGARRRDWTFTGSLDYADGGALEDVVGGQLTVRYDW
jgi:outer membrane autotransporter protein